MKSLAILGASGHGRVVADTALSAGWEQVVFYDDAWPDIKNNNEWEVVGNTETLVNDKGKHDGIVVAIGDNRIRLEKTRYLMSESIPLATIVHPDAIVSSKASLGGGSVVFAGAVINYGVILGLSTIVNTRASIDHDCKIEDSVHICPGAIIAGGVHVGAESWIGIGSSLVQYITIGSKVVVGAGAAIIGDVADGLTMVGVPATILNKDRNIE